jgi:hypothetical protein
MPNQNLRVVKIVYFTKGLSRQSCSDARYNAIKFHDHYNNPNLAYDHRIFVLFNPFNNQSFEQLFL